MPEIAEKPKITIHLSGGMVQNVYTTLETEVEVVILDFDDNGTMSEQERDELEQELHRAASEQRHIY